MLVRPPAIGAAVSLLLLTGAAPPSTGPLPTRVGQCVATRIHAVGQRLEDGATGQSIPGSGSTVDFANGVSGVSYDRVPAVNRSRPGDPVRLCLASIPRHCPPGDDRGRFYRATNLRTHQAWTLPDAEHMCGGA